MTDVLRGVIHSLTNTPPTYPFDPIMREPGMAAPQKSCMRKRLFFTHD
jgi:hypothetical protein